MTLSKDNNFLYAVNTGSDDISVFAVNGTRLRFLQKISAGDQPTSITLFGDLLYVLNSSVAGKGIRGFTIAAGGTLTPLPDSFRALSWRIAVPGIVQFSPDGQVILVTHKVTNELVPPFHFIDAFTIGADGRASAAPIPNESILHEPKTSEFVHGNGYVRSAHRGHVRKLIMARVQHDFAPFLTRSHGEL